VERVGTKLEIIRMITVKDMNWDTWLAYLEQMLQPLEDLSFAHTFIQQDETVTLTCTTYPAHLSSTDVLDIYHHTFCKALAEFVVEELEEECIYRMIRRDYGFDDAAQVMQIYRYCFNFLFLNEFSTERDERKVAERKHKVFRQALACISDGHLFHLEGFVRFRLLDYFDELAEVIEYAIDEYVIDKEYQEFIHLLRFFISKQEAKLPLVHVVHIEERKFALYNQEKEPISAEEIEHYLKVWNADTLSQDDLLVSTLMAIAPKKVILHSSDPTNTVVGTLKNIFQHRLHVCLQCRDCTYWRSVLHSEKHGVKESVEIIFD
jgi:putative sporulation protein YtxC